MSPLANPLNTLQQFTYNGSKASFYSLPALEQANIGPISKLPVCIRIVLESLLRNYDDKRVTLEDIKRLANWNAKSPAKEEIPFVVSRILLQDFTGVPLLVDLAAMRDAVKKLGKKPSLIEPLVPVDLVVDHSVQVDSFGTDTAYEENLKHEFHRNRERYEFLKWGQQAFESFRVVPPAIGIVHQVNLEYLAQIVISQTTNSQELCYLDSLVGTDSHTTMINGLGIVGWGVGGIEAEAGMLGQPVYFQTPEVIGVHLSGKLNEGVTATDLTLRITEMLRKEKVVDKFVEFFGEGAAALTVADRATIANMAPEYGATMGFFPIDEKCTDYLISTGRTSEQIERVTAYLKAQNLFGMPRKGEIEYTKTLELNLSEITPCVAGPKRPQDRIDVPHLKSKFKELFTQEIVKGGYGKQVSDLEKTVTVDANPAQPLRSGDVVIAAITSCTNTSNPSVMVAAGLIAKRAVEAGLKVNSNVKTSLAPGSRVVTDYLEATGLQKYLDQLGFNLVGYGCTTCIGNSGPLSETLEKAIKHGDLVVASVLSGNRNFEARIHSAIKANFLMSPPLVVAYALAGRVDIDLSKDPIGHGTNGNPVYLKDLWPSIHEIDSLIQKGLQPEMFKNKYAAIDDTNLEWNKLPTSSGDVYEWNSKSTYIQLPPFFENFSLKTNGLQPISNMRALAIFGDSVTTDHISPAGSIAIDGAAGRYLLDHGVTIPEFNSYGSRRGNDRIMTRGTFGNVRIKNLMAEGKEGSYTYQYPEKKFVSIYDACQHYKHTQTPLIIFAGKDYGMGSSRDWAAKGTALLGVRAVVAQSFERIHRSNLIGMGVLPLEFLHGQSAHSLNITGEETFSLPELNDNMKPGQILKLIIHSPDGKQREVEVLLKINTNIEMDYYRHGGILPYVLRKIIANTH
jgi:aconitate hydratase